MITLLDGAMGQELINRTPEPPDALWATSVMMRHPEVVRAVHDDYFRAGAIIATSNTYAIHRDRLRYQGIEDRFRALHETALGLACQSRDAFGAGHVAGSMGPLVASYRPDLAPPAEEAADAYAEIAQIQAPFVDLFILETMASIDQAVGAVMGAGVPNKPIWLAVSVDDKDGTRLRSGEPLSELADALAPYPVQAILANCSLPEAITTAVPLLPHHVPTGAYANGFTEITEEFAQPGGIVDDLAPRADLGVDAYADYALRWIEDGATIVGGCCEIGPKHIQRLARMLDHEGHERTRELTL